MTPETIPIGLLPGAPRLFVDYVTDFPRVGDLFEHDFRDREAFVGAARAAVSRELPREEVANVLTVQNRLFGSGDRALGNIERLRDRDAVAVVTGQQPGLFGGPLYNLYKAVTAVRLAEHLELETGGPHVPVFWVESDDHQVAEIDHVHILDADGRLERVSWPRRTSRRIQPISALRFDEKIGSALERIAEVGRGYPHLDVVLGLLAESFRAEERLTDAFARLLASLFAPAGLVLVDPTDPGLRRLGIWRLRDELAFPSPTTEAARTAVDEIEARGYDIQVPLRDDRLNLFWGRSERFRVRCGADGFQVDSRSGKVDVAELRSRFDSELEQFSPNVLLRPLYQDALLPTVAYVAGPSEVAYFAQLKAVYSRFGIPMPVIYPRKSITLLNDRTRSLLDGDENRVEEVWKRGGLASPWLSRVLLPDGQPQERMLGILQGLLECGLDIVETVLTGLTLLEFDHQLLDVPAVGPARLAIGPVSD
jgi:bacillithiol biosynthesis cysteine-adding enzyme BshC